MAALLFTYGTMAAGKSTLALQLCWQLRQAGASVEMWTFGDRAGDGVVTSRLGIASPAVSVVQGADLARHVQDLLKRDVRVLVVDEVQFATPEQVEELAVLVDDHLIDVHCFGLGADFRLEVFPGTARLFAIADSVSELPLASYCWCGSRGRCNARIVDGVVQRSGAQRLLGDVTTGSGSVSYQVLCRRHWRTGELKPR